MSTLYRKTDKTESAEMVKFEKSSTRNDNKLHI